MPEGVTEAYAKDRYGRTVLEHMLRCGQDFFRQKCSQFALPARSKILEVGSFTGAFLIAAGERGWRAVGVDIGAETAAFTQSIGLDVRQCDLSDGSFEAGIFDAVFIWNTFDQFADPASVLAECARILRSEGILVIRVPNANFEAACLEVRKEPRFTERVLVAQAYNNFVSCPYLCLYTPNSLSALVEPFGFELREIQGDTILPLFDSSASETVLREERQFKRGVRRVCDRIERQVGAFLHPWIDAVYRRT